MKYRYLSYRLTDETPVYGGKFLLHITRTRSISSGDSANVCQLLIGSHCGTHVDAPNHFFEFGNSASDYAPEFWFFRVPHIIKVSLATSEILRLGKWAEAIDPSCDILIFKAGWGRFRDEEKYGKENPGIHPDVGIHLRKKVPNIRAIGIDWISISSYQDRPLGREAHKVFLDPKGEGQPILIIEDMDLSQDLANLKEITAFPLRVAGADSAPCTVVGGFK